MNDTPTRGMPAPGSDMPPLIDSRVRAPRWRWVWVAGALVLVVMLGLLFRFNPSEHAFYPFCVFHRMTGLQCPGCGGLRATHQLLHGHIALAFRYNPLVVTAAPFVLIWLARRWWRGPGQPLSHQAMVILAWLAFAVLVTFWIVRNLPFELFQLPNG